AARYCAREKLPGDGWIFLDLRSDFPDAWALFRRGRTDRDEENGLAIRLSRRLFPYLPGDPAIGITRLAVLFETEKCCDPACPEASECPCPPEELHCGHLVEVKAERPGHDRDDSDQVEIRCVSSADWPRLYHGVAEIRIEPIGPCDEHRFLYLSFSEERCELTRAYLLCHYKVIDECCIRASET
uniref:hypothetical protein n=1 Tax=Mycobacterium sp. TaxID=1785 RepID=UPI003F9ACA53